MNGVVEVANKNITNITQKMTKTYHDWHKKIHFALFTYWTSIPSSIGVTPFSLAYGIEAILLVEVEILSLRIFMETKLKDDRPDFLPTKFHRKRGWPLCLMANVTSGGSPGPMIRKSNIEFFQNGEFVLMEILPFKEDHRGRFKPNNEGPFVVTKAVKAVLCKYLV